MVIFAHRRRKNDIEWVFERTAKGRAVNAHKWTGQRRSRASAEKMEALTNQHSTEPLPTTPGTF
jgi:hypothetical protein